MNRIEVDPELFREHLQNVLSAAQELAAPESTIAFSGFSQVLSELLTMWSDFCSCVDHYYDVLQSDIQKAEELVNCLVTEDQQIGEVIVNGS